MKLILNNRKWRNKQWQLREKEMNAKKINQELIDNLTSENNERVREQAQKIFNEVGKKPIGRETRMDQ